MNCYYVNMHVVISKKLTSICTIFHTVLKQNQKEIYKPLHEHLSFSVPESSSSTMSNCDGETIMSLR